MTTEVADVEAAEELQHAVAWDAAATTVRSRPEPVEAAEAAAEVTAAVRADAAATAADELQRALRSLEDRGGLDDDERAALLALAGRIVDGVVCAPAGRATELEAPARPEAVLELFDVDVPAPGDADHDGAAATEVEDV